MAFYLYIFSRACYYVPQPQPTEPIIMAPLPSCVILLDFHLAIVHVYVSPACGLLLSDGMKAPYGIHTSFV